MRQFQRLCVSPRQGLRTIIAAAYDMRGDPFRMRMSAASRYVRVLATVAVGNARRPAGITGAARAFIQSGEYTPLLHALRDSDIPTIVLHGERDLIVPFESARDIAKDANATLYRIPDAYHSWMIATPQHGADSLRQLLDAELGEVLCDTAKSLGIKNWRDGSAWDRALVEPDAPVRKLNGTVIDFGRDTRERVELELVRRVQRRTKSGQVVATPTSPRVRVGQRRSTSRPDARTA